MNDKSIKGNKGVRVGSKGSWKRYTFNTSTSMWSVVAAGDSTLKLCFQSEESGPSEEYIVRVVSGHKVYSKTGTSLKINHFNVNLCSKLKKVLVDDQLNDDKEEKKNNSMKDQEILQLRREKEELALQVDKMQIDLQVQMTKYVELLEDNANALTKNNHFIFYR